MPSPIAKTVIAAAAATMLATAAGAQAPPIPTPRSRVEVSTTPGMPEFRDPKTGQIWTPENVGQGPIGKPTPADLAFDPLAQAERIKGVVVQRPNFTLLGWAAPSAGPATPLVTMDNASLRAVAGKRWQVVLYVNNNSAGTLAPMIDCRFTNAGKLVEETRVLVPGIGAGVRGGITIYGPRTDLFVDRADCRIVSP
ncbi:MAG: hypothetical protein EPO41_16745 [Reyranella sp.]|uniref:hypothetical protein n=1 Tax=Reyranella sp. TaxID=1929291 RepID=UPI0011F59294|nr:hypothetical protein [Reyranella sp.]TAJ90593.1 MAG: hypothetical protein EPO41_16745 [Reyranella sp.]